MPIPDITGVMGRLAAKRPFFHSEADSQHALAWEIHEQWPSCFMRLEFRPVDSRSHIDIWATDKHSSVAIELKYKTRKLRLAIGDEAFELLDQSAQDIGRYDFLKDIQRLEKITATGRGVVGVAILLTNDSAYWTAPRQTRTVDEAFRINEGQVLTGLLRWGPKAAKGTTAGREEPLSLKGIYRAEWRDYSEPSTKSYGRFRYLHIPVSPQQDRPAGS